MTDANLFWTAAGVAFTGIALWETYRPRRDNSVIAHRWGSHAGLVILCNAAVMLVFRTSAVAVAASVQNNPYGLLNRPEFPFWLRLVFALLLLDITRYAQHYLFHSWGWLWRFHQVHHADADFDLTTGVRFHPVEALFTYGTYLALVALIAPPAASVILLELATICQDFFSHANASLPGWLERPVRMFVITPDLHSIHHSERVAEQNTNFGTVFPWWDRLFGTYLPESAGGRDRLTHGLKECRDARRDSLFFLLYLPFRRRDNSLPSSEAPAPAVPNSLL